MVELLDHSRARKPIVPRTRRPSDPYTVKRVWTVHARGVRHRRRSSNRTGKPMPPAMMATQMGNMIQASSTNPMRLSL